MQIETVTQFEVILFSVNETNFRNPLQVLFGSVFYIQWQSQTEAFVYGPHTRNYTLDALAR